MSAVTTQVVVLERFVPHALLCLKTLSEFDCPSFVRGTGP
jgi:hypothetical protein